MHSIKGLLTMTLSVNVNI